MSPNVFKEHIFTGKKPYKCKQCPYEAFRSDSMTAHMMHKHKTSVFLLCEKCGRSLPTTTAFKKHQATHDRQNKQIQNTPKVRKYLNRSGPS